MRVRMVDFRPPLTINMPLSNNTLDSVPRVFTPSGDVLNVQIVAGAFPPGTP